MTILDKFIATIYEYLIILITFIPISISVTLAKTLINIKRKTEANFGDIILEFVISLLLSCIVGILTYDKLGKEGSIILTAIIAWRGSKISSNIDSWAKNFLNKYNNDKKDGTNT